MGEHRPTLKGNPLPHQVSPHKEKGPISPPRRWEPPEGQQGALQSPVLGTLGTGCGIQPGSPWGPGGQWRVTVSWWEPMRTQGLWGVLHGDLDVVLGTGSGGGHCGTGWDQRDLQPQPSWDSAPRSPEHHPTGRGLTGHCLPGEEPLTCLRRGPREGSPNPPHREGAPSLSMALPHKEGIPLPHKASPHREEPFTHPSTAHGSGFPSPTLPQWGRAAHGAAPDPKTGARGTGGHLALLSTGTQGNPTAHSQP